VNVRRHKRLSLHRPSGALLPGAVVPGALLLVAAAGWWWSARMAAEMTGGGMAGMEGTMSLAAFLLAWAAMMAAMMLPAALPVVRLYARAAAARRVAPLPFFIAGYLVLWSALGLPAYAAWRALDGPLAAGADWAARVAAGTLLAAAVWQLTPLKTMCLRHCRSPMAFFFGYGERLRRPGQALAIGMRHATFCIGCCWALFAALVALGTMNLLWMVLFTAFIVAERAAPGGERIAVVGAALLALLGAALLAEPSLLDRLT
jgi:predicted metal-binding membrane protein